MRRLPLFVSALLVTSCALVVPAHAQVSGERKVEVFGEHGPQGYVEVPPQLAGRTRSLAPPTATVTPIEINGPSDKRIDLVYLGDGYTESEQDRYASQVAYSWNILAQREPFRSYRKLFNVWQVNVVSNESGSDNDPTEGVVKDTALHSTYYCDGLERLICLDVPTAESYASLAPAFDQIAVVINSPTYGGAGYIEDDLVTFSGGHSAGAEILPHELGHSLGDLADEYPYWAYPDDGSTYTGEEPPYANVSIHNADQQVTQRTKWWYWLGEASPDGGTIGTFEGAYYYNLGIYRPSDNSLMRSLRQPFNLVGREEMTRRLYETTGLVDSATPNRAPVRDRARLTVAPVPIPTVTTRWFINGHEVTEWAGRTSVEVLTKKPKQPKGQPEAPWCGRKDLRGRGACTYTVRVTDTTDFVRNPTYQRDILNSTITWKVQDKPGGSRPGSTA